MARWSTKDSEELYQIPQWGRGYFRVNDAGNLQLDVGLGPGIDLKRLIDDLQARGITLPVLLRFGDLIGSRVHALVDAFAHAREEYSYTGEFRGVYPIKVNQDASVVDTYLQHARPHHMGLEAGSKPELQIILSRLDDPEALIICNGYKDREYIQMALLARKLGSNCIIVVEQAGELELILEVAAELELQPMIGVRAKLSSKGAGRWQSSVGDRAKFGLTAREIVDLVDRLRRLDRLPSLQLLHFHIGSQVTSVRAFQLALREATRLYTELHRMGAAMGYLDVGGGLGVDYDGSQTNFESSMNYSMQEYAFTVVAAAAAACNEAKIAHPHLITEAGRAMVAHHSALIFNVLGTNQRTETARPTRPGDEASDERKELWEVWGAVTAKNLQEPFHDAVDLREQCLTKFNLGLITLEERAEVDRLFWAVCTRLRRFTKRERHPPEELERLDDWLADTYYCNFSVFQSVPDAWAIDQLFPALPIHRLDTEPKRRAVLADLTCDSDGTLSRFIDRRDVKSTLEVHALDDQPYYLGLFLVGAYQEILGDLHNLFGDTHEVQVEGNDGALGYRIVNVAEGDTVRDVLGYVKYERKTLVRRLRSRVEAAITRGELTPDEGGLLVNTYIRGLQGYTYLS